MEQSFRRQININTADNGGFIIDSVVFGKDVPAIQAVLEERVIALSTEDVVREMLRLLKTNS